MPKKKHASVILYFIFLIGEKNQMKLKIFYLHFIRFKNLIVFIYIYIYYYVL